MSALQQVVRGKILILTICAAGIGGTFQYGYNLTIINAPTVFIQSFINETWLNRTGAALEAKVITLVWSFIVAVYPLGGLVGALIAAPMAVKMGRKKSLLLNNAFVALAALLVGFSRMAKSFEMILLSRFFAGINSGRIGGLHISQEPQAYFWLLAALQQLRGSSDLSSEMKEILAEQAALQGQVAKAPWELWRNRAVRWQFITVVVLSSAMQLCGNDSMYSYASYVFQEAGIPYDKIQYSVIGTGSCELIMSMTCNLLIECVGRRVLLIGGYSLMATWAILFMVALSLQDQFSWMPYLSMACIFAYILSFGIGPAGVTGIIPTEIFDQVARPAAYTISGSVLWINLFLVGLAFPFVMESLGYYCYLPFFMVCVGTALYVWFFLPETKGKSFLEISEEFIKRNFGELLLDPTRMPAPCWTFSGCIWRRS
ncbi:solute carrier family 2, facilitated glucose transporter member 11 [Pantherophis guttatus]|uniref:Solute carrier family 2, facilitated glucose transporter member 11 n=1 Tax=Pantherophis guttatus TaxID=94885 RepID=A0ABM3YU32_PANGU|nr:solute carrier family 2, facilitated glucose transporter member 11 [Pantherophis guttatus]